MGEIAINPIHNVHKKYRTMNLVNSYIFTPPVTYNTYIGGVSASVSSASLLASKLGISVGAISNFTIVGSDIKCKITGSYAIPANAFEANTAINYYIDSDGLVIELQSSCFYGTTNIKTLTFLNAATVQGNVIFNSGIESIYLANCTTFINNSLQYAAYLKLAYIPRCVNLGSTSGNNGVFAGIPLGLKIYAKPSLATNNGGAPDGDLVGHSVSYVSNFTEPNAVTTLAAGTIYNTAIQLNFTAPIGSTNTIDYYECWSNGVKKNNITASGNYITGLTVNSVQNITIIAVDIFYNKSVVSNSINVTTTNVANQVDRTGLVSYYTLNSNSNDGWGVNNGTDTSVTYAIGKVGNAGVYNGATSKTIIGNPANLQLSTGTISCWIKTSGAGSSYRSIFGKTLAYNMFLVDGILMVYNWSAYGTTGNKSTAINLNDNLWHHIAFVFESGTANNYLYIDGVLKLTFSWANLNQTDNVCIGSSNSSQYFNGLIDEPNIYNVKLTQSQIGIIYNSGNGITL